VHVPADFHVIAVSDLKLQDGVRTGRLCIDTSRPMTAERIAICNDLQYTAMMTGFSAVTAPSLASLLGLQAGATAGAWPERACWPAPVSAPVDSSLACTGLAGAGV